MTDTAIDAVITWVDGSDPKHAARLQAHLASLGGPLPNSAHATRFHDAGEIEYCIASIFRFAPWISRIHIVTDQQVPPLLAKLTASRWRDRVVVVDHREIFSGLEHHLPTFNSRAIISVLWRIPGLAEHFIYFNDDFVLLHPVRPDDFFRDGKVILRGQWRLQSARNPLRRLVLALRRWTGRDPRQNQTARVRNLAAQEYSAQLAGFSQRYLRMFHNPFPMRRSTLEQFFAKHPDLLEANLVPKLRAASQFKTECLAACLEYAQGHAWFDNTLQTTQIKPDRQGRRRLRRKLADAAAERYAFAVVQSLDQAEPAIYRLIVNWLEQRIGNLDQQLANEAIELD